MDQTPELPPSVAERLQQVVAEINTELLPDLLREAGVADPERYHVSFDITPIHPATGQPFEHPEIGRQPGYVVGECGHAVASSEWAAGFRTCERCPKEQ